jgi:hypothetical protein
LLTKEISIVIDKIRVVGVLDATTESLTVQIQSPFGSLKAGVRYSGCPMGDRRFPKSGKLKKETIQCGEEILKGLYLAGKSLQRQPEFLKKLRKYLARFDAKAMLIQQERKHSLGKFKEGKITKKVHDSKLVELVLAENQNVIGRGVVFRQYAEKLTRRSGGRADIRSVLDFTS